MSKSTKSKPRTSRRRRSERRPRGADARDPSFAGEIRSALLAEIRESIVSTAQQLVADEVRELVGAPWSRKDAGNPLRRGGRTRSTVQLGGEAVVIERTRVRDRERGEEHSLKTVRALASRDALDEDVHASLVRGVSTRDYDAALSNVADGLGLQKSAVSSAFRRASQKDLDALNGRSLAEST